MPKSSAKQIKKILKKNISRNHQLSLTYVHAIDEVLLKADHRDHEEKL